MYAFCEMRNPYGRESFFPSFKQQYLKADYELRKVDDPENATPPYHYSSHYSNSGTVLHFLVRLPPFTSMFLKYQGKKFCFESLEKQSENFSSERVLSLLFK